MTGYGLGVLCMFGHGGRSIRRIEARPQCYSTEVFGRRPTMWLGSHVASAQLRPPSLSDWDRVHYTQRKKVETTGLKMGPEIRGHGSFSRGGRLGIETSFIGPLSNVLT